VPCIKLTCHKLDVLYRLYGLDASECACIRGTGFEFSARRTRAALAMPIAIATIALRLDIIASLSGKKMEKQC
jgi:hypothetical protein